MLLLLFGFNCFAQTINLHDTNGQTLTANSFENKWLVINYWADWCDNCKDEIADLNAFQKNKNSSVLFYGVNYDGAPKSELQQLMKKNHMTYPNFIEDPRDIWHLGDIEAVPVTFIIDPQGNVAKKIYGGTTASSLEQAIKTLQHAS